jgi:hypothetical protein
MLLAYLLIKRQYVVQRFPNRCNSFVTIPSYDEWEMIRKGVFGVYDTVIYS